MKRIFLLIVTNVAVMVVLSITASILGVDRYLTANGLNFGALIVFSGLIGFGGAFISLLISKWMAKMSVGAQTIDGTENADAQWLVATVRKLADKAGVGMPEVAVYEGAPNAFATGAFRDSALVAVSTGLLQSMTRDEVEAVLGHELSHVANGDMVTLTLVQGVVNTFVVFLSRVVGYIIDRAVFRNERDELGFGYMITVLACQVLFGIGASIIVAWFSRQREFRADAGSAHLLATPRPMIAALRRLGGLEAGAMPQSLQAFGIAESSRFLGLFASHPPIEERIAALEGARAQ
jgi:heat shock protein HtpX